MVKEHSPFVYNGNGDFDDFRDDMPSLSVLRIIFLDAFVEGKFSLLESLCDNTYRIRRKYKKMV